MTGGKGVTKAEVALAAMRSSHDRLRSLVAGMTTKPVTAPSSV
jgi:hypothetical protein